MIALDTNVLVRFLTADDAGQYARARAFLAANAAEEGGAPRLLVTPVVVCELVWVLISVYGHSREAVGGTILGLLESRDLAFGERDRVEAALRAFRGGKGDFADYLLREQSLGAGCESVATFDRTLLREPGFRAP